jgi:hypothetical protein
MKRSSILADPKLNSEFYNKGFVKFKLLNETQIQSIKEFYFSEVDEIQNKLNPTGFHTTSNTHDNELLKKVDNFLKAKLLVEVKKHFRNSNFTIANFLVKESGEDSAVPPHQDWLLVDETKYTSFNIWICLDEVNTETGCLKFIPRSQLQNFSLRCSGLPRYFDAFSQKLEPYYEKVFVKPGECLVFHHSIIHSSEKNSSFKKRISCVLGGFVDGATLFFYTPSDSMNRIKRHVITVDNFLDMQPEYYPSENVIRTEETDSFVDIWTYSTFLKKLNLSELNSSNEKTLFQKFFNLLR